MNSYTASGNRFGVLRVAIHLNFRATYEPVLQNAWRGLQKMLTLSGEVGGIIGGCGVQSSPAAYNHSDSSTPAGGYDGSSPGLGSVIRAAVSLARYEARFGPL